VDVPCRIALIAIASAACGRLGFALTGDALEATDDGTGEQPCPFGPFSAPARVGVVNAVGHDDWSPSITSDGRALYFHSLRVSEPSAPAIWRASRADEASPFDEPAVVGEVSSANRDSYPAISGDDLTLLFASDRPGGAGSLDIWMATRTDRDAPFSPPVRVVELSSPAVDLPVGISPDGLSIMFISNRGTSFDLFRAGRPALDAPFGGIARISEVNSAAAERSAAWSADGLTLVFSSDRSGGQGSHDLWLAHRTTTAAPFDPPTNLVELNSPFDEFAPGLSNDSATIYFAYRARISGGYDADIWMSTRSRVCP
jgi:Tol biopolymer transport system component